MVGVNVDMPDSCCECFCNRHDYMCSLTENVFCEQENFRFFYERMPDCPLVDLQKPPEAVEAEKTIERMRGNLNRIREVLKVLNE